MCVGCDRDSHGCIPSAGYLWCETSQQCVRPWEVSCPSLQSSSSSKISISCDPYLCKDGNSYPSCTRQGSRISYFMDPCALNGGQINASSASSAPSLSSASSIPVTINIITDPDPDHSLRSTFLKLGSVSPVLAWAKAYSDPEPIAVRHITMTFDSAIRSMQQIILYTEGGFLIGRGTLYSADGRIFKMDLSKGDLTIPYRNSTRFYLRILTGEYDRGGTSGETAHVSSIVIDGTGLWSFADYSSETIDTSVVLPTSETARSVFNNISNAGPATDVLAPGPGRSLGSFSFSGTLGDPNAKLTLTSLLFSLSVSGGVTVSNPQIAARGSGQSTACSVINSTISCPALPEYIGSIGNSSKILDLSGDIAIASNVNHASLNVSLNPGGTVTSPGAASWTDGTTTFQWIPYDRVDGTNYQW